MTFVKNQSGGNPAGDSPQKPRGSVLGLQRHIQTDRSGTLDVFYKMFREVVDSNGAELSFDIISPASRALKYPLGIISVTAGEYLYYYVLMAEASITSPLSPVIDKFTKLTVPTTPIDQWNNDISRNHVLSELQTKYRLSDQSNAICVGTFTIDADVEMDEYYAKAIIANAENAIVGRWEFQNSNASVKTITNIIAKRNIHAAVTYHPRDQLDISGNPMRADVSCSIHVSASTNVDQTLETIFNNTLDQICTVYAYVEPGLIPQDDEQGIYNPNAATGIYAPIVHITYNDGGSATTRNLETYLVGIAAMSTAMRQTGSYAAMDKPKSDKSHDVGALHLNKKLPAANGGLIDGKGVDTTTADFDFAEYMTKLMVDRPVIAITHYSGMEQSYMTMLIAMAAESTTGKLNLIAFLDRMTDNNFTAEFGKSTNDGIVYPQVAVRGYDDYYSVINDSKSTGTLIDSREFDNLSTLNIDDNRETFYTWAAAADNANGQLGGMVRHNIKSELYGNSLKVKAPGTVYYLTPDFIRAMNTSFSQCGLTPSADGIIRAVTNSAYNGSTTYSRMGSDSGLSLDQSRGSFDSAGFNSGRSTWG